MANGASMRDAVAPGEPGWRPRSLDELTQEERAEYDAQLDSGVTEMPPNQIKGLLGEKGPDLRKPDDFAPISTPG